jgi:tetratricopeptide (TPR) repeat protein
MVHMPSHIYMRVGRYQDSFDANRRASDADAEYIAQCNAQGIYPLNYYPHNLHFLVWSAMFQGRSEAALAGAREVETKIPVEYAQGTFEIFLSQPMYVMVRFGMWDAALAEPQPAENLSFMNGVWHYMRGMAYSRTGERRRASRELRKLTKLKDRLDEDYVVGFGTVSSLLTIAELVLSGEIDARAKRYDDAIASLSRAVRLEDSLMYAEPPDWYFPTRHVLGAVLIEAGLPVEAATVYWQDLKKNPDNGYSLYGLAAAYEAQGNESAAMQMRKRFEQAWASADVQLSSSRF